MLKIRLALSLVLTLALPVDAGDVQVVPFGTTTADFQLLVTAADDGDIFLIDDSVDLETVTIVGKGVALVSNGENRPSIDELIVQDVPAGSTVVIRGLELRDPPGLFLPGSTTPGLRIVDCDGAVLVEDCLVQLASPSGSPPKSPGPGVVIDGAASVSIADSSLGGGHGLGGDFFASEGRTAVDVVDGRVTISNTMLEGGSGGSVFQGVGAAGAPGLELSPTGFAIITGCDVVAGVNGGQVFPPEPGGPTSAVTLQPGAALWRVDSTLEGSPEIQGSGTVVEFPSVEARGFTVTSPLREGETGALEFDGKRGDLVALMWSFSAAWVPLQGKANAFIPGFSPFLGGPIVLGPNPAPDGQWSLPILAPSIDVIDGQYAVMQAFVLDADSGDIILSDTSTYVLVDEVF